MDDQTVVVGMSDGMISIRRDEPDCGKNTSRSSRLESKSPTRYPQFEDRDLNVSETLKEVMSKHDALLRKFEYSKALDQALMNQVVMKSPYITVAVFQELIRRNGLVQALAGRDRKSLGNVLKFIIRHVGSIIFGSTLIVVSNSILGEYTGELHGREI
ncbi:hypothetical protein QAD02_012602 [Eretmocerus hayati]|uniref:Uncharacterized protein n=1 Tax=Eretmocerus hayati TaxID=131215 RepID=A0ACC2P4W3_9HYME|nr:hypothetical protein QAD02_012602 [Eretmocerus hayati]